ncbi:hypothetical protein KKD37_03125 [Patescibacteria group bacterium]|nr:hypothetical protein [Patescibacteria group bacterium]
MGELSKELRTSRGFFRTAVDVITQKGTTFKERVDLLDEIGTNYFPEGKNSQYFQTLRSQIDLEAGPPLVCAISMVSMFTRFGVPCNYGLVAYVADKLPELKKEGKITVEPERMSEVDRIVGLAAKVSKGNE